MGPNIPSAPQAKTTPVGLASVTVKLATSLIEAQMKGRGYFDDEDSNYQPRSFSVNVDTFCFRAPYHDKKSRVGRTQVGGSLRGVKGPELGMGNLKQSEEMLSAMGFQPETIEKLVSDATLRAVVPVGVAIQPAIIDGAAKEITGQEYDIGIQYRGAHNFRQLDDTPVSLGDLLEVYIPSKEELNTQDWRALEINGGDVSAGQWPLALRAVRRENVCARVANTQVLYRQNPEAFFQLNGPGSATQNAFIASAYNTNRFFKLAFVFMLYEFLKCTGLTLAPIEKFDEASATQRTVDGRGRDAEPDRDIAAGSYSLDTTGSEPCAAIRRSFVRQANAKLYPIDNVTPAGDVEPATEPEQICQVLAVGLNALAPSASTGSDQSRFGGILAQELRAQAAIEETAEADPNDRDDTATELLTQWRQLENRLMGAMQYGLSIEEDGADHDSSLAFGDVAGKGDRALRNIARLEDTRNGSRPNPDTELGQLAIQQTVFYQQGLGALYEQLGFGRRNIVGFAIEPSIQGSRGAAFLCHPGM